MRQGRPPTRKRIGHTITMMLALFAVNAYGDDPSSLLSDQRWREFSYGVSLSVPVRARLTQDPPREAIARMVGEGYAIDVYIKKATGVLRIQDVVSQAILQFGGAYPSAVMLHQGVFPSGGHPSGAVFFSVTSTEQQRWVIGQGFIRIDPSAFVMLEIESNRLKLTDLRSTLEAVMESIQLQDQDGIHRERRQHVLNGQRWFDSTPIRQWHDIVKPLQWFRIVENNLDVGYMRISQRQDTTMNHPGIRVEVQSRYLTGKIAQDMISSFFAADDGGYEEWSIRTTVRPDHPPPAPGSVTRPRDPPRVDVNQPESASWAETGVRSNNRITVSREGPTGIQEFHWEKPPVGYLSQARVFLLDQLLTPAQTEVLGFYAYNPNLRKITYRTDRVESSDDGSYVVYSRVNPEAAEQASYYNPMNDMTRCVFPGNRMLHPVSKNELAARWNLNP